MYNFVVRIMAVVIRLHSVWRCVYNIFLQKRVVGQCAGFVDVRLQYLLPGPLSVTSPSDGASTAALQRPAATTNLLSGHRSSTCPDNGRAPAYLHIHQFYRQCLV